LAQQLGTHNHHGDGILFCIEGGESFLPAQSLVKFERAKLIDYQQVARKAVFQYGIAPAQGIFVKYPAADCRWMAFASDCQPPGLTGSNILGVDSCALASVEDCAGKEPRSTPTGFLGLADDVGAEGCFSGALAAGDNE